MQPCTPQICWRDARPFAMASDHKGTSVCPKLRWSAFVLGEFHHCITRSRHDTAPRAKKHANRRLNCPIVASSAPRRAGVVGRGTRSRRHCNSTAGQGGRHQSRAAAAARRGHRRRARLPRGMQADGRHVPESSDTLPAIADRLMEMIGCTRSGQQPPVAATAVLRHRPVQQSLQSRPELLRQQRGGAVCSRVQRLLRWQRREFQQSERAIWVKKVPKIAKMC